MGEWLLPPSPLFILRSKILKKENIVNIMRAMKEQTLDKYLEHCNFYAVALPVFLV